MGLFTWGMLPKSQTDPEKIEEAINRIVKAHNENPEAHLGQGQSLQSHKMSEIIDHRAVSIVADKIRDFEIPVEKFFLKDYSSTLFESLDGWFVREVFGAGAITARLNSLYLRAGATINSKVWVWNCELSIGGLRVTKNSIFETAFRVHSAALSGTRIIAGIGDAGLEFGESDGTASAYGFKVIDGVLKAFSCRTDGTNKIETAVDILGIALTGVNQYRAIFTSGLKIEYYVNGILKATITDNLPMHNKEATFVFGIRNTVSESKEFYIRYGVFSQEL